MNIGEFFILFSAGIVAGFVFEIGRAIKLLLKNKIYFVIAIDFVVAIAVGVVFVFAEYNYLNFNIFGFTALAFLAGIFVERISLGFLVAKTFFFIYNVFAKWLKKFSATWLGKRTLK